MFIAARATNRVTLNPMAAQARIRDLELDSVIAGVMNANVWLANVVSRWVCYFRHVGSSRIPLPCASGGVVRVLFDSRSAGAVR